MSEYDVMVDLETLGVSPTSAILQIGACTLDQRNVFLGGVRKEFYDDMHAENDFSYTYDEGTLGWWDEQSDEAKESLEISIYPSIESVLIAFTAWYDGVTRQEDYPKIWANSPSFDLIILKHAYKMCDMDAPWNFWQERCYRTFKSEFGFFLPKEFDSDLIPHRADHDAIMQARRLTRIMDRITLNV